MEFQDAYRSEPTVSTLGMGRKHCYACAAVLDVRAEMCPKCGIRQPAMQQSIGGAFAGVPSTTKNKTTAGLFALLLGGIGVHKFYLGSPGVGVLYILFCWTLIPALIALAEGIVLLTMSDDAFARKYPG